eukprot:scaffold79607_cov26-Tisochrysis_lutea.AAC.1
MRERRRVLPAAESNIPRKRALDVSMLAQGWEGKRGGQERGDGARWESLAPTLCPDATEDEDWRRRRKRRPRTGM